MILMFLSIFRRYRRRHLFGIPQVPWLLVSFLSFVLLGLTLVLTGFVHSARFNSSEDFILVLGSYYLVV